MKNARKTTPEKPKTAPSTAPDMKVVYGFGEKLEETRRRLHHEELDRRYPILSELEIDVRHGTDWEELIDPLFQEARRLRLSLKRGRLELARARSNLDSMKPSLRLKKRGTWA
jgi:transcriptional regulator